jgi:hypothetical protein
MSNVRSMQRGMKQAAPEATAPQTIPLAGQNYRVRRLFLKAELDVYTPDGVLVQRGLTDDLVLVEAEFPPAIMAYFIGQGMLAEGFKTFKLPSPTPSPAPGPEEGKP